MAGGKTCVLTISCWNNAAHVISFLEAARPANPQIGCWAWAVADRPEFFRLSSPLLAEDEEASMRAVRAIVPALAAVVTLEDLQRVASFPLLELAFKYGLVEFNTAIKAVAVRYVFDVLDGTRCLYFDNDVWIMESLWEIEALLETHAVVVTPHVAEPNPLDGLKQTDVKIGQAGIFNFGFVAFADGPTCRAFLQWWDQRLRWYGYVDVAHGMHFDQGWGNFVPAFFDHDDYYVLRDPRFNVAYWNLHYTGPQLDWRRGALTLGGAPVVFVHLSGRPGPRLFLKTSAG